MYKTTYFLFIVLISINLCYATAHDIDEGCHTTLCMEGIHLKENFINYVTFYERWDTEDYFLFTTISVGSLVLALKKEELWLLVQDNLRNDFTDDISSIAKVLGNRGVIPKGAGVFYLGGLVFNSPRERMTGLMLMEDRK